MIVIIGGFGRTGRVVTERTLASSAVRLVSRDPQRAVPAGAELAVARLTETEELRRAFRGASAAFVLLPDDLTAVRFRIERRAMVDALATALRLESVPRIVLLSSMEASLGEQGAEGFGTELAYLERRLSDMPAALTILRASYFQDNVAQLLPSARTSGTFPNFWPSATTPLPMVAAADVGAVAARSLLEALPAPREIVDVLGPEYSPVQVTRIASAVLGRALRLTDIPPAAQEHAFSQGMSPEAARAMVGTLRCLGSGRISLHGDRSVHGETRLEQLLAGQVQS